jgi:hypothetical protein
MEGRGMIKTCALSPLALLVLGILGCPVPGAVGDDAGQSILLVSEDGAVVTTVPGATGAGCDVAISGGAALCTAISLCPSIAVDPATFSGCGFRIRGDVLDLECECSGFLCPIGAPTTCAEVGTLLSQQNSDAVCSQMTAGTCIQEVSAAVTTTSDAATTMNPMGTSPGCDTTCESECVGDPNCIQACGC